MAATKCSPDDLVAFLPPQQSGLKRGKDSRKFSRRHVTKHIKYAVKTELRSNLFHALVSKLSGQVLRRKTQGMSLLKVFSIMATN